MSKQLLLSVIIPAYNEAQNFRDGKLAEVDQYLLKQNYDWEVFVVDDGSTDNTVQLIKPWIKNKKNWQLIENEHYGKAHTVTTGMLKANGKIRVFTDFDQATPISTVEQVIDKFKQNYEVVIGSREAKGARRDQEPFLRHLMGRVFNLFVQIIAVRSISDTQCGFKAFSDKATKELFNNMVVYKNHRVNDAYMGAFDVELIFMAKKKKYKITQIPVKWSYVESTRVNPAKDSLRMLWDILKIRLAHLTGKYN